MTLLSFAALACGNSNTVMQPDAAPPDATPGQCKQTISQKQAQFATQLATASAADPAVMIDTTGDQAAASFAGHYRDNLAVHVGCAPRTAYTVNTSEPFSHDDDATTAPAGTPAAIPGYHCAAEEFTQPAEDVTKPIVILVHGNSAGVTSFEEFSKASIAGTTIQTSGAFSFTVDTTVRQQLASKLVAAGYKVYGFDARTDKVAATTGYDSQTNAFLNMDHGWGVPMLESLIKSVMLANPTRKVSLVGHSLGATDIRDALRRLYNEHKAGIPGSVNPFPQLKDAVYLSGSHHGVAGGNKCDVTSKNMKITVLCEMGDRAAFAPTYFTSANNGPGDIWTTPCADGDYAYGDHDACGGNTVQYTTVTMKDIPGGMFQDEFVSEASSSLDMPGCVDNKLIGLDDIDRSGYFFLNNNGFFASHFGSARSDAGIALVMSKLAD